MKQVNIRIDKPIPLNNHLSRFNVEKFLQGLYFGWLNFVRECNVTIYFKKVNMLQIQMVVQGNWFSKSTVELDFVPNT